MKVGDIVWELEGRDRTGLSLALVMIDHLANSGKFTPDGEGTQALSDLSDMISEGFEEAGIEPLPVARNIRLRASGVEVPAPSPRSELERNLDCLYALAQKAKDTPVGFSAVCPACTNHFHKYNPGTVYCSNAGMGNCKDAFFNLIKRQKVKLAREKGIPETEWKSEEVYSRLA